MKSMRTRKTLRKLVPKGARVPRLTELSMEMTSMHPCLAQNLIRCLNLQVVYLQVSLFNVSLKAKGTTSSTSSAPFALVILKKASKLELSLTVDIPSTRLALNSGYKDSSDAPTVILRSNQRIHMAQQALTPRL